MNRAREAFIAELKDLRGRCGSSSYRVLATMSEKVSALYEGPRSAHAVHPHGPEGHAAS